jgi:uncharacterized protein (TIGR02001 family)
MLTNYKPNARHAAATLLAITGAAAALLCAAPAQAQEAPAQAEAAPAAASPNTFTANLTLASEYRYRGIMQTNSNPAIQGGFDYSHSSGFYVGNWNSNISWLDDSSNDVSAPIEMDFYGGFRNTYQDIAYDVGVLQYYYPGNYPGGYTSPNTTELYGSVGYGPVTAKLSYAPTNLFGFADSKNSWYADLTANVPLNVWGLTLNTHIGYQKVQVTDASYADWKIGLTKDLGQGFAIAVAYIDTDAKRSVYTNALGRYTGSSTAFASLTKTF